MRSPIWNPLNGKPPYQANARLNTAHPLNNGLLAWFIMNENAGNKVFDITKGTQGVFNGGAAWNISSLGVGVYCDNSGDRIIAPAASCVSLDTGTLTFIFVPNFSLASSGYRYLCDVDDARITCFKQTIANTWRIYIDGSSSTFNITGMIITGIVCRLTMTYNKSTDLLGLWINGVSYSGSKSGTWGSTALGTNFYIGDRYTDANYGATSTILQVITHNRVLSAGEIQYLHSFPFGTPDNPRLLIPTESKIFMPSLGIPIHLFNRGHHAL